MRWDIFCKVIDNYGDIGICWRLARQLTVDHAQHVRLWVDDLQALVPLCPTVDPTRATQDQNGITLCRWEEPCVFETLAECVIGAFACRLPEAYLAAMQAFPRPPFWINLEYLSAEKWVEGCHGMRSPMPRAPLCVETFFFPGFTPKTGGLFKEKNLVPRRKAFQAGQPKKSAITLSLFAYDHAPYGAFLMGLAAIKQAVIVYVTAGKATAGIKQALQTDLSMASLTHVTFEFLPFLPQAQYDHLLWSCDFNFVRGEDSFVRAQWAGRPFVWHIYPQAEQAHLEKLDAFLTRYAAPEALTALCRAWNTGEAALFQQYWPVVIENLAQLKQHAEQWCDELDQLEDVASQLVRWGRTG